MHERPSSVAAKVKRTSKHTLIAHIFGKQFNIEMLHASLNLKTSVCFATVFIFLLKGKVCHYCTSRGTKQNYKINDCF